MTLRKDLRKLNGRREKFVAEFVRFGKKSAFRGPDLTTLLFCNVRELDSGNVVTDHIWFNLTKGFEALDLQPGDIVEFEARVGKYKKGYFGYNLYAAIEHPPYIDYKLSRPTKINKQKAPRK